MDDVPSAVFMSKRRFLHFDDVGALIRWFEDPGCQELQR